MKMLRLFLLDFVIPVTIITFLAYGTDYAQVNRSVAELTRKSSLIVVGKINSIESEWNKEKTRIYSRISVSVDTFVKGQPAGDVVSFMQPGGEVGKVGEIYSDIPRFRKNENVLLFLEKDKSNNLRVTGGMDGKFSYTVKPATGEKMIDGRINLNDFISEIKKNELLH